MNFQINDLIRRKTEFQDRSGWDKGNDPVTVTRLSINGLDKQMVFVNNGHMTWESDRFDLVYRPHDPMNDLNVKKYAQANALSIPVQDSVVAEKQSSGKPPLDILFRLPGIADVARGFDYGATKYPDKAGDFNWRQGRGDEAYKRRLAAAALRHIHARLMGERIDSETKIPHLALAACNVLMMADIDILETK